MPIKKVLLVDDEAAARQLLKQYLEDLPDINVTAECKNGIEAIGLINVLKPDLVFLDIQMPGKTGFEVLQEIDFIPQIIFSTAFDQYALKAFEVNAVDYLLKPYTKERLIQALNKALVKEKDVMKNLQALTESLQSKAYPERILVEQGTRLISLVTDDVIWLEAEGDYTKIHTAKQAYLSNKGIGELESKLNPLKFKRIHRSAIIALAAITQINKEPSGPQVVLVNEKVIKVSRSYIESFKELIF